ncbi:MAG: hypothetical protein LBG90_04260 [Spirochaetaceae bacterium]|nr:hypothetical protein [Spirochaetaceae bacterium]
MSIASNRKNRQYLLPARILSSGGTISGSAGGVLHSPGKTSSFREKRFRPQGRRPFPNGRTWIRRNEPYVLPDERQIQTEKIEIPGDGTYILGDEVSILENEGFGFPKKFPVLGNSVSARKRLQACRGIDKISSGATLKLWGGNRTFR